MPSPQSAFLGRRCLASSRHGRNRPAQTHHRQLKTSPPRIRSDAVRRSPKPQDTLPEYALTDTLQTPQAPSIAPPRPTRDTRKRFLTPENTSITTSMPTWLRKICRRSTPTTGRTTTKTDRHAANSAGSTFRVQDLPIFGLPKRDSRINLIVLHPARRSGGRVRYEVRASRSPHLPQAARPSSDNVRCL